MLKKHFSGLVLQALRDSFNSLSDKHFGSPSYWQQWTKPCIHVPPEPLWSMEETASLQDLALPSELCSTLGNRLFGVWREKQTAFPLIGISWAWLKVLLNKFHHHPHSLNQNGPNKQKGFPLPSLSFWWVDISHAADYPCQLLKALSRYIVSTLTGWISKSSCRRATHLVHL